MPREALPCPATVEAALAHEVGADLVVPSQAPAIPRPLLQALPDHGVRKGPALALLVAVIAVFALLLRIPILGAVAGLLLVVPLAVALLGAILGLVALVALPIMPAALVVEDCDAGDAITRAAVEQVTIAIEAADVIIFVVDIRDGAVPLDI